MDGRKDTALAALMEHLIKTGPDEIGSVFARAFDIAMEIERERFLRAGPYERSEDRRGYANGYKPKRLDTPAGTITVHVPKTADHGDTPFYPASLDRGRRSVRSVLLAAAEMYVKGVSTREVEAVMKEFGIEGMTSEQVSRASQLLDEDLRIWRERPLGVTPYLILDARYEKVREAHVVRDVAVLSAIGVDPDGHRRILGVSVASSEGEVHWRDFLESLVARGLRGVEYIVSDNHNGLRSARRAVFGAAIWQRCQFHLAQNAVQHAPNMEIRKHIGAELRRIWDAASQDKAQEELDQLVAKYLPVNERFANWLRDNIPEGFAVFSLPAEHQRKMRTSNPIERNVQQELKRRTVKVRIFPSIASLLRLVSAVLVEIDDKWTAQTKRYLSMETENA